MKDKVQTSSRFRLSPAHEHCERSRLQADEQKHGRQKTRLDERWLSNCAENVCRQKRATVPFINGKYYMNPAYGRAMERARAAFSSALAERAMRAAVALAQSKRHTDKSVCAT